MITKAWYIIPLCLLLLCFTSCGALLTEKLYLNTAVALSCDKNYNVTTTMLQAKRKTVGEAYCVYKGQCFMREDVGKFFLVSSENCTTSPINFLLSKSQLKVGFIVKEKK